MESRTATTSCQLNQVCSRGGAVLSAGGSCRHITVQTLAAPAAPGQEEERVETQ